MPDSGLADLANDLRNAANKTPQRVHRIVSRHGTNTEKSWRRLYLASSVHGHAKYYPAAVTKDMRSMGEWITAEVGPDKGKRQGPLGNLIEFGSRNNTGQREGEKAIGIEEPHFIRSMERAADLNL